MSEKYPHNFLKNVTARIDFGKNYVEVSSGVPNPLQDKIKLHFPYVQKKGAMAEQLEIVSETDIKRRHIRENHWFFQAADGSRTLCIAPNFLWIDYKKYGNFSDLKEAFTAVVDGLFEVFPEFSLSRFGLRFFNEIELTDPHVTEWKEYLNGDMLTIFDMADDKTRISRAFQNLEMNYGDFSLTFLYGMHNPDYPAPLKRKTFVLDFDAYALKVEGKEGMKGCLQNMHDRIETLFEKSITDKLRGIMG